MHLAQFILDLDVFWDYTIKDQPFVCKFRTLETFYLIIFFSFTQYWLMASIRTSKSCGIGLGVLLLLGARRMIFIEGCLSQICREIGERCSFDIFFVYSTFCIEDLLSSMLVVISFSSC